MLGIPTLIAGGCATLDARPEIVRSAAHVERATDVAAGMLLLDSEAARARTSELLSDGLSADEAVQVALLNNPRARAAMLDIGVSRADLVQSTLFTNPTLALSLRFPEGGGLANLEAALAQNIAELWLIPTRKQSAQRRLDRTVLEAANTIAAIAYDARRAYVRAAKAREEELISHEALHLAEQLLETAKLRQQAGTGHELDVSLARTRQLEAETALRNAQCSTFEAHAELARILGLIDFPDALQLTSSLPDPIDWAVSADVLHQIARENRLDLRIAEQAVSEARSKVNEERRRLFKSVEAGWNVERGERRSGEDGGHVIAGPTLGLELPLWDRNQAQVAKAELVAEQTIQLRDAMLVDVAQDIHSCLARARAAALNATSYRQAQLPEAERMVSLSRMAYQAGTASFLSVLEADRSYLAARSGYLDALERAAIAAIELEQATGCPTSVLLAAQESTEKPGGEASLITERKP